MAKLCKDIYVITLAEVITTNEEVTSSFSCWTEKTNLLCRKKKLLILLKVIISILRLHHSLMEALSLPRKIGQAILLLPENLGKDLTLFHSLFVKVLPPSHYTKLLYFKVDHVVNMSLLGWRLTLREITCILGSLISILMEMS